VATAVCAPVVLTQAAGATAPGKLAFEDCFGNAGAAQCAVLPGAPLDDPSSVAVSADGKSVYVVSSRGNSIERFSVKDAQGHLRYAGCLNNHGAHKCDTLPGAPLNRPVALEVSPDGKSLYVVSWRGESIEEFAVADARGRLEYRGCQNKTGAHGCLALPGSPLDLPISLTVSPDSRTVYVMSAETGSIASFSVERSGERLAYEGCVAVSEGRGCAAPSQFRGVDHLAISPDGTSAYGIAWSGSLIEHFRVSGQHGQLTFESCLGAGSCGVIPGFPLQNPAALVMSPDGRSVYVVSANGNWLAHFSANGETGGLVYRGCYDNGGSRGCRKVSGFPLEYPLDLAISGDGKSLYVVSALASLAEFSVTGADGELTYVSSPKGPVSAPKGAVVSPNGTSVYVISGNNSVAQFVRTRGSTAPRTQLAAKIVSASVLGRGMTRTIRLRVQVSEPASATLRLLKGRVERLRRQFALKAGRNDLTVPVRRLSRGAYQLELTVTDARGQLRVYRVAVRLPA
jgi:DNA-binding beta-propeller fold protein YncE